MLILTRHLGETIVVSDDIQITILKIKGCQVSLGIHAPTDVSVHRLEIYHRIQDEKSPSSEEDLTDR